MRAFALRGTIELNNLFYFLFGYFGVPYLGFFSDVLFIPELYPLHSRTLEEMVVLFVSDS